MQVNGLLAKGSMINEPLTERDAATCAVGISAMTIVHRHLLTATSAQLEGTPTIPPSYIPVRAVLWECGEGQTDRHRHTDGRGQYTFCLGYASREM